MHLICASTRILVVPLCTGACGRNIGRVVVVSSARSTSWSARWITAQLRVEVAYAETLRVVWICQIDQVRWPIGRRLGRFRGHSIILCDLKSQKDSIEISIAFIVVVFAESGKCRARTHFLIKV